MYRIRLRLIRAGSRLKKGKGTTSDTKTKCYFQFKIQAYNRRKGFEIDSFDLGQNKKKAFHNDVKGLQAIIYGKKGL